MKNIDWDKAPSGATHHNTSCTWPWLKETPPSFYNGECWVEYTSDGPYWKDHFSRAIKRPQETESKEWDGKGLPSVGTECEYLNLLNRSRGWVKVKVVFIGGNLIVLKIGAGGTEFSEQAGDVSFRPIKTPAQIAAEGRLRAIDEMLGLVENCSTFKDVMGLLYDAGYHKTEPQKCLAGAGKPLSVEELKAGGWVCEDVSKDCASALKSKGLLVYNSGQWGLNSRWDSCLMEAARGEVARGFNFGGNKQIHRIGNDFYWGKK